MEEKAKELRVHMHCVNKVNNTYCISVVESGAPIKTTLAGKTVIASKPNRVFGLLSVKDSDGNKVTADHPLARDFMSTLNKDDLIPEWKLSNKPVLDTQTGEETGMFWAEPI